MRTMHYVCCGITIVSEHSTRAQAVSKAKELAATTKRTHIVALTTDAFEPSVQHTDLSSSADYGPGGYGPKLGE